MSKKFFFPFVKNLVDAQKVKKYINVQPYANQLEKDWRFGKSKRLKE